MAQGPRHADRRDDDERHRQQRQRLPLSGISAKSEPRQQQPGDDEQQEREPEHQQVSEPPERRHEVVAALARREVVVGRAVPRHQAAPVEPQDLHRAEAPAVALRVQPGERRRHDAAAEAARDVQPRPAGLEHPERGLGVLADAPLVPAADALERAAAEQAHRADERHGVAFVPRRHDRQVEALVRVDARRVVVAAFVVAVAFEGLDEADPLVGEVRRRSRGGSTA